MKELKAVFVFLLLVCHTYHVAAQDGGDHPSSLPPSTSGGSWNDSLKAYELKLKDLGDSVVDGVTQTRRILALKKFIPTLVKALKFPGSFYYPFDSLTFFESPGA